MAIHRIEVADPIEGDAIRAALRERGLVVVKRSVEDVTRATEAALVILAADAPGGLDALASLRATASTAVVRDAPAVTTTSARPSRSASQVHRRSCT